MSEIMPDTSPTAIGKRLGEVREARGFNQAGIATALGISPQRWNLYEGGSRKMPPDMLAKFWQVTGATSDFVLFDRMDSMPYELAAAVREMRTKASQKPAKRA